MSNIDILVGTTLGGSEYVADELAAQLAETGHEADIHLSPDLDQLDLQGVWLLVCSTHGAGDLPDNIQPLLAQLKSDQPDLSQVKYALCAIGDSSYDTFCQGPELLVEQFEQLGAQALVNKIRIDVQQDPIPEEAALSWLAQWQDQL
ncbi:FMN-binding protein MioC [Shewanella sp. GXUN23E]|uniref:FMN-binding protein MioC n=1 Tax=Shewanella sp. GXUN23E TaxID=3422498 RepID=UPI003D7D020B